MNIQLRLADLNDLREIQTLFVETIKNTCQNDYNEEQIKVWVSSVENIDRWNDVLTLQHCILAIIEDKIVGFGTLKDGNYIDFMYVHHQFLRLGIANLIFSALEEESKSQGFQQLNSDVSYTARPFFEKKGFKVIKENKNVKKGVELINFKMRT